MMLSKAVEVIGGINEGVNLFQWVGSAVSSLRSGWNGKQEQKLQEDEVLQLQSDLECLRDTLPATYHLIDRAEWRGHEKCVAELLPKLKNAVYDAEDILDGFRWYELKLKVEGNATQVSPFIDFFCTVTQGRFNKVIDIQKRLNSISSQLEKMGLCQIAPRFDKLLRPETTSFPTEPKIFGREEEMKKVIKLLGVSANSIRSPSRRKRTRREARSFASSTSLDNNDTRMTNVPVLPIVGIGGVGKTTLAQNICNHQQVKSHFDLIIWTCVSDDFDVKRLTKEAIEQSSESTPATDNLNSLQKALGNSLRKKRFLMVLDDMWDDALKENGQCWKRFCAPFTNVVGGSMMLVTTRFRKVADLVCTMDPVPLEGLKDQVFWDFFKLCIFGFDSSSINPVLECIGKRILPKLTGSPLAAKTLGRLLGSSLDPIHWDRILKSELWELNQEETEILPALRLSYIYLPFHLKRCFSFCAVYPKDFIFEKDNLSEIWVAEGFVEPQGNTPLQHIGCRYFEELVKLSFFQKFYDKYVIHDLMHDMAQLVSKDECFIIKGENDFKNIPENVRHISISDSKRSNLLSLCKYRKLRTLHSDSYNDASVIEKWCTELLYMRVIFCYSLSELPEEGIRNLKHLRFLKTSGKYLENLPSTLCSLYNLQILCTKNCMFDYIPTGFSKLINLQRFESLRYQFRQEHAVYIREGARDDGQKKISFIRDRGESLPSGFHPHNLTHITSLLFDYCYRLKTISFSINSQGSNSNDLISSTFLFLTEVTITRCEELSSLERFLRPACIPAIKKLVIQDCPNVESVPTERFEDFHFLEELTLSGCPKISSRRLSVPSLKKLMLSDSGNVGDNIECRSLIILHLSCLPMESVELQMWNLPVLQELEISNCFLLKSVKDTEWLSTDASSVGDRGSIGKFPLLTHLTFKFCSMLETLDERLLHLPVVESFRVTSCERLSLPTEIFGRFHCLKDLSICDCPRFNWQNGMVLPSSLRMLILQNCGDFSTWFPRCLDNLTSLKSLWMEKCDGIVSVPGDLWSSNLASLQELVIENCTDIVSIGGLNAIAHIEKVYIEDCPNLEEVTQPLIRGEF